MLAITGLHDIEEDIWSPKWGLKGKVDASVQAAIQRPGKRDLEETVAPLEIKTGRAIGVMAHRAQTMLYTLLMEDRYGEIKHPIARCELTQQGYPFRPDCCTIPSLTRCYVSKRDRTKFER